MNNDLKKSVDAHGRRWQRFILATFSVVFLLAGGLIDHLPFSSGTSEGFLGGTLLKVGVVLGLAWLAAPQLERLGWHRLQGSLLVAIIIVLLLWAIRPRIGAMAGAILVAGSLVFGFASWFRSLGKP